MAFLLGENMDLVKNLLEKHNFKIHSSPPAHIWSRREQAPFNPAKKPIFTPVFCHSWNDFCWFLWSVAKEEMPLKTLSGRKITPPVFKESKNLAIATKQRRLLRLWLYEEAIMESLHKKDRSMFERFCSFFDMEKEKAERSTEDDADSAYCYLFVIDIKPQFHDVQL